MIFNNSVTLYHDEGGRFCKRFFARAYVAWEEKLDASGGGQVRKDTVAARIFTSEEVVIAPGDRFVTGKSEAKTPPENSYLILGASKKLCSSGRIHHYKITAV